MNPLVIFRLCIVLSVILGLGSAGVDLMFPELISAELSAAAEKEFNYQFIYRNLYIFLVAVLTWMVLAIVGGVGAFLCKRWGRSLSLYTTVTGVVFYPFAGPFVSSGVAASLGETSYMLWGAALAMAYFSPVSERFESGR